MAVVSKKSLEAASTPKQEAIRAKTLDELETEKKDKNARSIEYQRKIDSKLVEGVFRFYDVPGGQLHFPYRAYKGDKVVKYSLRDNEIYKLPLGVAKHLANNCWYAVHRHEIDVNGKSTTVLGNKKKRTGFESLEFMDSKYLNSNNDVTDVQVV